MDAGSAGWTSAGCGSTGSVSSVCACAGMNVLNNRAAIAASGLISVIWLRFSSNLLKIRKNALADGHREQLISIIR